MTSFDDRFEYASRRLAMLSSRRGILARFGKLMLGAAALGPILPIDRSFGAAPSKDAAAEPTNCDYWKYCALDGNLCSCCGGSGHECPPGTQVSKVSWVGTCHNAGDGKNYLISYADCCGRSSCGQCFCNSNVGERPGYQMGVHNDVNWCMANTNTAYQCTVTIIVGTAD